MDRTGDNIAFAPFVGIPLAALCWAAAKALDFVLGRRAVWIVGGAGILAWPVYRVSMTADNRDSSGLALLLFTTPVMLLGWIAALARVSRR